MNDKLTLSTLNIETYDVLSSSKALFSMMWSGPVEWKHEFFTLKNRKSFKAYYPVEKRFIFYVNGIPMWSNYGRPTAVWFALTSLWLLGKRIPEDYLYHHSVLKETINSLSSYLNDEDKFMISILLTSDKTNNKISFVNMTELGDQLPHLSKTK